MKIKEVCERTGLTDRTVRFYVEKGLLQVEGNVSNGRVNREYSEKDVEMLKDISKLREAGFSIQEILDMQNPKNNIQEIFKNHCKKLEEEHKRNEMVLNKLNQMYVDNTMSWHSIAQNLFRDSEELEHEFQFGKFDEPVVEGKKNILKMIKNKIAPMKRKILLLMCLILVVTGTIWGVGHWQNQRECTSIFAMTSVTFHKKWIEVEDDIVKCYADISTNPEETFGFEPYFFERKTVRIDRILFYDRLTPNVGSYLSVTFAINVPYGEAKELGLLRDDRFLDVEKILENEAYVKKYCVVLYGTYQ